MVLSGFARAFINQCQGGFPVTEGRPFARLADALGSDEGSVLGLVRSLLEAVGARSGLWGGGHDGP